MRLTYFAARGTCDKVRLMLVFSNVEYEETIIAGRGTQFLCVARTNTSQ